MLGGNDVGPRGEFQLLFVASMLLLAAIINANIFGNITILIQSLNRKAANFQEKMDYAGETMKNMKIPEKLQDAVKSYLTYTQTTQDLQQDLDKFLNMLSPSLRHEVSRQIFLVAISKNVVFRSHNDIINAMIQDMQTKLFLPEDIIMRQGDAAKHFYFLARGECDIYVVDENKVKRNTKTLPHGSYFGEVALIKN